LIKISEVRVFQPTTKTDWIFIRLVDEDGFIGLGECSYSGSTTMVVAAAERMLTRLANARDQLGTHKREAPKPASAVEAAASAGIDQALTDLLARRNGVALARLLGQPKRDRLSFYANINRSIVERTPAAFRAAAVEALSHNVQAVKIAPFDAVTPAACLAGSADDLISLGFDRIAAVKDALGSIPLMVDCHWRFDVRTAASVIDRVRPFDLAWLECPVPETTETLTELRALRRRANDAGMKLAGGERAWKLEEVDAFLANDAYDVIMPDVKYTGSLATFIAMGRAIQAAGIEFSPHNPTGPIAHAMTLEACALFEHTGRIEYQHGETSLFDSIVDFGLPTITNGSATLNPNRHGLGLSLHLPHLPLPDARETIAAVH
jgi:galactonate dehydratase